jgi:methionyl-tRNA formyltransferase
MSVDLLVGGTLGGWALTHARPAEVTQVVTEDATLVELGRRLGFVVCDREVWEPSQRGLSVHYQRIIPAEAIARYEGLWNLHPGFLPWGRGFYPVFWALWEGSPAGATLHEVTSALDGGPIVDQIQVSATSDDTGGSLHARVQVAEHALFARWWPRIVTGEVLAGVAQPDALGNSHSKADFFELKRAGWRALSSAELARLERCLEFPGASGVEH